MSESKTWAVMVKYVSLVSDTFQYWSQVIDFEYFIEWKKYFSLVIIQNNIFQISKNGGFNRYLHKFCGKERDGTHKGI